VSSAIDYLETDKFIQNVSELIESIRELQSHYNTIFLAVYKDNTIRSQKLEAKFTGRRLTVKGGILRRYPALESKFKNIKMGESNSHNGQLAELADELVKLKDLAVKRMVDNYKNFMDILKRRNNLMKSFKAI